MNSHPIRSFAASLLLIFAALAAPAAEAKLNTLTDAEGNAGWRLLFDGQTTAGWRRYRGEEMPRSWRAVNGSLISLPKSPEERGDIMTIEQFGDFEVTFDWKMAPGGNSGLQYRVTADSKNPWDSGPEYQVLDNTLHEDGNNPLSSAGACYAVYPPLKNMARTVGQWNRSRLVVLGNHVEHWLNGRKVVAYDIGSKEWLVHVKTSKFINSKAYGRASRGHLCLQALWFPDRIPEHQDPSVVGKGWEMTAAGAATGGKRDGAGKLLPLS